MATYRELIERANQLAAGIGADAEQSPLRDAEMTAEAIFPHAVRYALVRKAKTGGDLSELVSLQTIAVVAGVGDLPEEILKDALRKAIFPNRPLVSYASFADFQRYRFSKQIDYFSFFGDRFYFSPANDASFTGNVEIYTPAIPELPTDEEDDVELPVSVVEEVILIIGAVLRGEMPLSELKG